MEKPWVWLFYILELDAVEQDCEGCVQILTLHLSDLVKLLRQRLFLTMTRG